MRIQKERNRCFTLIELLMVITILAILVSFAIPTYNNIVEGQKGKSTQLNMITIASAARIYNLKHPGAEYDPGGFVNISTINSTLGTVITENYFGRTGIGPGFWLDLDIPTYRIYIRSYRLSGNYQNECIACYYNYSTGEFNWNPGIVPWVTTWPLKLNE